MSDEGIRFRESPIGRRAPHPLRETVVGSAGNPATRTVQARLVPNTLRYGAHMTPKGTNVTPPGLLPNVFAKISPPASRVDIRTWGSGGAFPPTTGQCAPPVNYFPLHCL